MLAVLFWLSAAPVQDRYGVCVLEEGATKAVPFGRLREQIQGITVTGTRAYLWTERALWWMDATGKRLVRVSGLPFTNRSGDSLLTHRVGLEPGGGLLVWSSDGRLWRVYDKATPVPGLLRGTEVYGFETGFRRTYLATNRGLWRLDSFHKAARPMPGSQRKVTGFTEYGEGALISQGKEGLFLDKGEGAPLTPISGPTGDAQVLSVSQGKNRALISSEEGLWSLVGGETTATFFPGSEKLGICFGLEFDGRRLWGWGGIEGTLRFYDLDRKAFGVIPNFRNEVTCVRARANDILVGTYFSGIFRVDKRTLAVRKILFSGGTVSDIVPFGRRMLIGTRQGMPH
jgi:hypothetical protein